jgi:hypothetical protein
MVAALSRVGLLVWLAAGVLLLVGAARSVGAPAPEAEAPSPAQPVRPPVPPAEHRYVSDYRLATGDEVVLVLVGASFCGAHLTPGFAQAVEDAKVHVQRQAKANGRQFRAIGVSLDWRTDEALEFLSAFGEFDEMSVGSNWVNGSALRYVWSDLGDPVVPQILVIQRRVEAGDRSIRVSGERVIHRIRGSNDILTWARSGATL